MFIQFDAVKGSFQGCSGSRSCGEQKQIWLGGDAWVSGGSIAHAYKPWCHPACCNKYVGARQKRKNGQNIASFNDHNHVTVRVMRNLVVHADFLWNSGIKTSYVCPQTRNNKGTMVISVMLVLIYHRHYTHGSMKTHDSGHFVNQRRTLRCKSQLVRHCPN